MKGKILDFNISENAGVISAEDSQRYNFVAAEWKSSNIQPTQGVEVDFAIEEGDAVAIYAQAAVEVKQESAPQMNAWQYYVDALKNYATFDGRAKLAQFWYYQLIGFGISFVLSLISAGVLGLIYALAVLVPSLAIGTRRLHDTGRSGWWQLLMLIPLIGVIVLIIFWAQSSQESKNQYDLN